MKSTFLLGILFAVITVKSTAQSLEHFNVQKIEYGYLLTHKSDTLRSGNYDRYSDPDQYISNALQKTLKQLPDSIKQVLVKEKISVLFYFDAEGNIFYTSMQLSSKAGFLLNDAQWLAIYHAIRNTKIKISALNILNQDFKTGNYVFTLSTLLKEKELEKARKEKLEKAKQEHPEYYKGLDI